MARTPLSPETFAAVVGIVAGHLRIKHEDRWSGSLLDLKYVSFSGAFPEVDAQQFLWAAETWVQGTKPDAFHRFPTWVELMAPLYRKENGLANRSWGFAPDLPASVAPTLEQLALLPKRRASLAAPPDPTNHGAYLVVGTAAEAVGRGALLLPEPLAEEDRAPPLTEAQWQLYLQRMGITTDPP